MKVFYSWQSNLPIEINKSVKSAVMGAVTETNKSYTDKDIEYDEATRNETGSPNIPETIFKKILECNIFICDITPVGETFDSEKRKLPNPNVAIELGFALRVLGWERIILIFNTHFGSIKYDVPFDFDKHRITYFSIKDGSKGVENQLKEKLIRGIKGILDNNPKYGIIALNENEIKRQRDLENLKWVLSSIDIYFFEEYMERLPNTVLYDILYYWEGFHATFKHSLFHLYDSELYSKVKIFHDTWDKVLDHTELYLPVTIEPSICKLIGNIDKRTDESYKRLLKEIPLLSQSLASMLSYIRECYYEIDLDYISREAGKKQREYIK